MGSSYRFATLSDCHVGYSSSRATTSEGVNLRADDGYRALEQAVTGIIESEVQAVIVPGDTFHVPEPRVRDIVVAQNQFRRFAEAGIPVYILAGNHDALDLAHEIAASRVLHDPHRNIFSHVEPYVHYELTDGLLLHMVSHHLYHAQADTMKQVVPQEGALNIFSTHGSVIDPIMKMKLHTEQSPREVVIPDALLMSNDWSYSMLGHIHERGWVGSKDKVTDTAGTRIFYSGSLIRRGFSDKEAPLGRGYTIWDIDSSGEFTPTFHSVDQRQQLDFDTIYADTISSSDITELIVNNLKSTHLPDIGAKFDERSAPILRQKVAGITPAKYAALDWKAIDAYSKHAMLWDIKPTTLDEAERHDEVGEGETTARTLEAGDVLKIYDDWALTAPQLETLEDNSRQRVIKLARTYVKKGQEEALDNE